MSIYLCKEQDCKHHVIWFITVQCIQFLPCQDTTYLSNLSHTTPVCLLIGSKLQTIMSQDILIRKNIARLLNTFCHIKAKERNNSFVEIKEWVLDLTFPQLISSSSSSSSTVDKNIFRWTMSREIAHSTIHSLLSSGMDGSRILKKALNATITSAD